MVENNNALFIKRFREKYLLTQDDLGQLLGKSTLTILRWENGQKNVRPFDLALLSYLNNRNPLIESLHQSIRIRGGLGTLIKWIRSVKD